MQPEAAGRVWDATQTWGNQLPEEDHPTHWIADRTIDWLSRDRSAILRLGELPRSAPPLRPAASLVRSLRSRRHAGRPSQEPSRGVRHQARLPPRLDHRLPRHRVGVGESGLGAVQRGGAVHDPRRLLRHDRAARSSHRPRAGRPRRPRPGGRHAGGLHRRSRRLHGRSSDDAEGADPLRGPDPGAAHRARSGFPGGGGRGRPGRHHRPGSHGVTGLRRAATRGASRGVRSSMARASSSSPRTT